MSFINHSGNLVQDNQRSTLFSFDSAGFSAESTADFGLDLEKQQQHHLRQFLYFQSLALQRSEEQHREQRSLAVNEGFGDVSHIYNDTRTSPDTSSGSVEDHLHDFIAIESLSDTSISAPSTPDLLGTNITSLPSKSFGSADLDLSPTSVVQTPAYSMTGVPSPLQAASVVAAASIPNDLESQSKIASLQAYDQFGNLTHAVPSSVQFSPFHHQGVEMHHMIQHAASDIPFGSTPPMLAAAARQRSFSIAAPFTNTYTQPAMPPYYVSGYPASYHQLYMTGSMSSQTGMFPGSAIVSMDSNQHQRTFSFPMSSLPASYFNPANPLQPTERAPDSSDGGDIAPHSRRSNLFETSASSRRKAQEHRLNRPKPYDKVAQTSSRSPPSASQHSVASKSRNPSVNADTSAHKGSSGSSTPASVIPESLKDLPASMIRNPHGGGRGYVPGETQEDPKKRHKCGICGRGFARLYNLKVRHLLFLQRC